ncbi:hypothetical protein M5E87_19810 [Flavonifractor plautii]|nr:hypothetical protein M5E87_19810 [Flavonifractor plautii]
MAVWLGRREDLYETASPCIACVCSALPDGAPRHRLRRQRAQARRHHHGGQRPGGEYYLDLLVTDPGDHANIDPADYDPNLLQGLRDWEVDGWYPALAGGTSVPLFGDLRPGRTVPIALPTTACPAPFVSPSPAQTGPRPRTSPLPARCSTPI